MRSVAVVQSAVVLRLIRLAFQSKFAAADALLWADLRLRIAKPMKPSVSSPIPPGSGTELA